MIVIEDTIVSDDIADSYFACDLNRCRGACCVDGDCGAPILAEEVDAIREIQEEVMPFLTDEGNATIAASGPVTRCSQGTYRTPVMAGKACAYATNQCNGVIKCGFELAWRAGITEFQKPLSCHLYPIKVQRYSGFEALNFEQRDICSPACRLGARREVKLYQFVKSGLVRKYGEGWYNELVRIIEEPGELDAD